MRQFLIGVLVALMPVLALAGAEDMQVYGY
jgi:hypothetical protein